MTHTPPNHPMTMSDKSNNQYPLRLVFWELTAQCNLKCQHCRAEAQYDVVAGELSTAEIFEVADAIRRDADPILILTGGEPLARSDWYKVAEHCCRIFSRVALATNGTLIDDAVAARIKATGIQRVSISLDGACAETHDAFRGQQGSFTEALRGFDCLKRAGMSLQANVTVTRHNVAEIDALLTLMLERGVDAFHVFMLVPVGCGAEIDESTRLSPEQNDEVLRWLFHKSLEFSGRVQLKATCAPTYFRIMREEAQKQHIALPSSGHGMQAVTRGCLAGSGVCFISRTGDVQPCGYLPLAVGNVREQALGDIWRQSSVFAKLRDPDMLSGKCRVCSFRNVCQGCRARAYAQSGDFLSEEPDCVYIPPALHRVEVTDE